MYLALSRPIRKTPAESYENTIQYATALNNSRVNNFRLDDWTKKTMWSSVYKPKLEQVRLLGTISSGVTHWPARHQDGAALARNWR